MIAGTPSICRQINGKERIRSLLSSFATWLFIAALASDSANLDDLFSSGIVLHDDDEIVCAGADLPATGVASNCTGQLQTDRVTSLHQISPALHPFVRAIIDQDSPSLAANSVPTPSKIFGLHKDSPMLSDDVDPPTGLLHLLFHSLLI